MSNLVQFAFKLVHPVKYAHTIIVQAADYNAALLYAQQLIAGTEWTIARVKNMQTGEVVKNS